jgi:hypothetical protein
VKAILTIKLTAYHRPISICFVGKNYFYFSKVDDGQNQSANIQRSGREVMAYVGAINKLNPLVCLSESAECNGHLGLGQSWLDG